MTPLQPTRRVLLTGLSGLALTSLTIAPAAFAGDPIQTPPVQPPADPQPELSEEAKAFRAWIDEYGRPTAEVMLNGQGPFEFLVDTGANSTVIAMRHALAVGAEFLGSSIVHGTTGSTDLPVARISELKTGAVDATDVRVAVLPDEAFIGDGILGADIFVGKRLYFDIPAKRVRVEASHDGAWRSGSRTATRIQSYGQLEIRNGMLAQLSGYVGRVPVKLMIDTGAQNCIANPALSQALARRHPQLQRVQRVGVAGITGQVLVGEFIDLPPVELGNMTVRGCGAVAADAPIFQLWGLADQPAMIVGVDVLSRLQGFSIDYGARRFDAKPMALLARGAMTTG